MGRYEVPCELFFPGFVIGIINDDFHIAVNQTSRDREVEEVVIY